MSNMYGIERKSNIISLLEQDGKVSVNQLAKKFDISKETIRRDLKDLEQKGALKRTHGGAVSLWMSEGALGEYPVRVRELQHIQEKNNICRKVAQHIEQNDLIFIDNSSTTSFLPRYLPQDKKITIITNSLSLLFAATRRPSHHHTYICLGGVFQPQNLSVGGSITNTTVEEFYPDKAFISCTGIHPKSKVGDTSLQEADTKKLMIERSERVYLMADHTKFGKTGQVYLTDFTEISQIVTDEQTKDKDLSYLTSAGVDLAFV